MHSQLEVLLIAGCAAIAVLPLLLLPARAIRRAARRSRRPAAVISLFDIIGEPRLRRN